MSVAKVKCGEVKRYVAGANYEPRMSLNSGELYTGVFFFQAEDGIRDLTVTGVQTCALPICARLRVDAADVRFRIGIGSSSHERLPNNYVKQRENQRVALFLLLQCGFFRRRQKIGRASCRERV